MLRNFKLEQSICHYNKHNHKLFFRNHFKNWDVLDLFRPKHEKCKKIWDILIISGPVKADKNLRHSETF